MTSRPAPPRTPGAVLGTYGRVGAPVVALAAAVVAEYLGRGIRNALFAALTRRAPLTGTEELVVELVGTTGLELPLPRPPQGLPRQRVSLVAHGSMRLVLVPRTSPTV